MEVEFKIRPVPKGRPRASGRGRFITMYTPKKTKKFETSISDIAKSYFKEPLMGVLSVDVEFYFEPVKSVSKKKREELIGTWFNHKNTDLDNLQKSFFDGLNGIAYEDDSQICEIKAIKKYSDENKIIMRIKENE